MQPQPLLVFLQSQAVLNNKQDKAKSCKHQSSKHVNIKSNESLFVSEIDKHIVSFFFDDKGLKLSLLN